jgi:hypothetical protein
MDIDRNVLILNGERLMSFLENNQLVQACATAQRIETSIHDLLKQDGQVPDTHVLWPAYKNVLRIKNKILAGRTDEALSEMKTLENYLKK